MTKKEKGVLTWVFIGLLLVIAIVAYLISIGKINFVSSPNSKHDDDKDEFKKSLSERISLLNHRYEKVQKILTKKRDLKEKLNRVCNNIFLWVRISLVLLLIGVGIVIHALTGASFKDVVDYIQIFVLLICFLGFVRYGNPINILSIWSHVTKKLTLYVYGRYINLDLQIESHGSELEEIDIEKKEVQKRLMETTAIEKEIQEVLLESNKT